MINVTVFNRSSALCGFSCKGHSGYAESGSDIVCAGVTSAVGLCVCMLTDVLGLSPDITVNEKTAEVRCILNERDVVRGEEMLKAFKLHISSLAEDYSEYISLREEKLNSYERKGNFNA